MCGQEGELPVSVDVFVSGQDSYFAYGIPCIVTAPDGSLLAFVEARKHNLADAGGKGQDIDFAIKSSTDRGRTWSKMTIIEDPGELWSAANAATVTDQKRKRLWAFHVRCKRGRGTRAARPGTDDVKNLARWSEDNGRTWSEPIDLTRVARDFDNPQRQITVPGPGGAIQTSRGRLIIPCCSYSPMRNFVISSDDHGATWRRNSPVAGGEESNENQVVELVDGRILMGSRQRRGAHRVSPCSQALAWEPDDARLCLAGLRPAFSAGPPALQPRRRRSSLRAMRPQAEPGNGVDPAKSGSHVVWLNALEGQALDPCYDDGCRLDGAMPGRADDSMSQFIRRSLCILINRHDGVAYAQQPTDWSLVGSVTALCSSNGSLN